MSEGTTEAGNTATQVPSVVNLTEAAVAKVNGFQADDTHQGKTFRVYIEGGGCSGFQYGFTFDEHRDDDSRVNVGDIEILVDPQSAMYLQGATVDWQEGLSGAGFVVRNPNASGSCGCGMSFSV
jgi:iron-sulfur cluster insertion protein